jgi:TPR repeat protein
MTSTLRLVPAVALAHLLLACASTPVPEPKTPWPGQKPPADAAAGTGRTDRAPASAPAAPEASPAAPAAPAVSPAVQERIASLSTRCQTAEPKACLELGALWLHGKDGVPVEPGKAAGAYALACTRGQAAGCRVLRELLGADDTAPRDLSRVHATFRAACDARVWEGCIGLAAIYADGLGVEARPKHAAELLRKACDGGFPSACGELALYRMYGFGVPRDEEAGFELEEKACDMKNLPSCVTFGVRMMEGHGVEQNETGALDLFRAACKGGEQSGCVAQAYVFLEGIGVRENIPHAIQLLRTSCTGGYGHACMLLGHAAREGVNGPADLGRALRWYEKGCTLRHGDSCFWAGAELNQLTPPVDGAARPAAMDDVDMPRARAFYERACMLHSGRGCLGLSYAFYWGAGGARDLEKSVEYERRACRYGVGEANCDDGRRADTRRLPQRRR